jgi:2-amino-4-hydroxy-6-hydroxymethyldihydropteridine diphosphokinase
LSYSRGSSHLTGSGRHVAYLGVGSNLGAREARVLEAVALLAADDDNRLVSLSSLYETEPVGELAGGPFINAVAEVHTLLYPRDLLNRLKTIEKSMGRTGGHNRARQIDLDVISYANAVIDTPDLVLPHPGFSHRAFVLVPLQEIAERFVCPRTGRGIGDLVGSLDTLSGVVRISGRNIVSS